MYYIATPTKVYNLRDIFWIFVLRCLGKKNESMNKELSFFGVVQRFSTVEPYLSSVSEFIAARNLANTWEIVLLMAVPLIHIFHIISRAGQGIKWTWASGSHTCVWSAFRWTQRVPAGVRQLLWQLRRKRNSGTSQPIQTYMKPLPRALHLLSLAAWTSKKP